MNEPETMLAMLGGGTDASRTLAVVGLSDAPERPSHRVAAAMQRFGFRIYPVNPTATQVLGEPCYPTLAALPSRPDVVNVFRLPRFLPALVEDMLALGLPALWVQTGIRHPEAAQRAEAGGIQVVMDRCILVEYRRLLADGHFGRNPQ